MSYVTHKVVFYKDGTEHWCNLDDQFHRENGPAVVGANGSEFWYKNGKLHREDGPAVVYKDGYKEWWVNGQMHREDGPAVVYKDGWKRWYLNGIEYAKEVFLEKTTKKSDPCDGKFVEIDGKKYQLSLAV